ncbi:MAG: phosphotransacetylase family protein [Coriobacteriia bacterium]
MGALLVISTASYSGKSSICACLIDEISRRGGSVGYYKPWGALPIVIDGLTTDKDAAYMNARLQRPAPIERVCTFVKTRAAIEGVLDRRTEDLADRVLEDFAVCADGRETVVVEGPSTVHNGMSAGLSACSIADILDARVILVYHPDGADLPDDVLGVKDCMGDRLAGVVVNLVHEAHADFVADHVRPFLATRGIPVFGVLPWDTALATVTVGEIADSLAATVLCAEERLDEPVESFMVGAMGQDKALTFFRRKARKAVVTGGDRADVQLAALETNTRCVVLTGNMAPSSLVLARADELSVPMLLVDMDTLSAVERLESLFGHSRLHDPRKVARIEDLFSRNIDVDGLLRACGVS